jgi:Ca2+-binding EF-hand superfamily protein
MTCIRTEQFAGQIEEQIMNVSRKKAGLGIVAVAVVLLGSAVLADNMATPGTGGPTMDGWHKGGWHKGGAHMGDGRMGPHGPMGMRMMMMPMFNLADADTNKDGKVTPEEFTAYHAAMVAGIDADKDGKISVDELANMNIKMMETMAHNRAERMVKVADPDGAAKLSVDDLASMNLKVMEAMAHTRAERMVKALDTDGDGKLSAAELLAAPMPPDAFAMMDTNKDGVIDQAEADAAQKMMQQGPGEGMDGHKMKHHKMPGADDGDAPGTDGQNGNGGN